MGQSLTILQKKSVPKPIVQWILFLILAIHTILLGYSAYVHSPVVDEPAYMVAGLSHWKFGRYELYRVNPPLIRMAATLPVLAAGYEENWNGFHDTPGSRPAFSMGESLVSANGKRSLWLFTIARWACIPFSWLGATTCYFWARDLFGKPAGLLSCALWCFSPNILGHASLMTTDAHAASLGVTASYFFWRWLKLSTLTRAAMTSVVLGLAQLAKITLILLYPLWPMLWIVYRWPDRRGFSFHDWLQRLVMLICIVVGSLHILNHGYEFEGSFQRLKQFHFVSELFTGKNKTTDTLPSYPTNAYSVNRFANSCLRHLLVPFPKNYLMGIDVQQKDFEGFTYNSYLHGEFRDHGWWYYYLYAIAIKVPLGTWLLGIAIVFARASGKLQNPEFRDEFTLLAPSLLIFCIASLKSGFSHHLHYVLICFPFAFIWLGQAASLLLTDFQATSKNITKPSLALQRNFSAMLIAAGLCWSIISSLWIYPHSLSYFNESVRGPIGGPNHLLSSNVDWGQDLRYLKWWAEKQPDSKPLHLAYLGRVNPTDIGIFKVLPWPDKTMHGKVTEHEPAGSRHIQTYNLKPGSYAISTNLLYGYNRNARDGGSEYGVIDAKLTEQLRHLEPHVRLGYSMAIFNIE